MPAIEKLPRPEAPESDAPEQPPLPSVHEDSSSKAPARTPEEERTSRERLAAVDREIDQLRQELFVAWEAYHRREEAQREQWALEKEVLEEGFFASVKRFLNRKKPRVGGRLTSDESAKISRGVDESNSRLHELFKERDRLEEELLDLETLRERRKTRWSKEYIDALQEAGRALTGEEKYQLGKGEAWHALDTDREIEDLKAKREGRELPHRYR